MDSLTQAVLGAVVVAVCVGPEQRRRALVYGACLGTLPDLDVLLPWPDPVSAMVLHRSFSHSLLVLTVLAPLLYAVCARLDPVLHGQGHRWRLGFWLALLTHPLLDAFTTYGTQLLWPLDRTPYALGSVFIIDPVYTLPLLVAVLLAVWRPQRGRWIGGLLGVSTVYLGWTALAQAWVWQRTQRDLEAAGLGPELRVHVSPAPFNSLLWRVVARAPQGGYAETWHSLWSETRVDGWVRHAGLPDPPVALPALQRLGEFSDGMYALRAVDNTLWYADLRMGSHPWYAFRFALATCTHSQWQAIPVRQAPMARPPWSVLTWLWQRILDPQALRPADSASVHWLPVPATPSPGRNQPSPAGGELLEPAPPPCAPPPP